MGHLHTNGALGLLLALTLLGAPAVAQAQRPGTRTFGPTDATSHTLQAFAFTGLTAADSAAFGSNVFGSRFCSGVSCTFDAALLLPAGALVTHIELEACDTNPAAHVAAQLVRVTALESGIASLASVHTGGPEIPGCNFFVGNLAAAETIDNGDNTYHLEVSINGADATTRFQAVRVFYTLQVSPAPAVATFTDVPTHHLFFQWIEALAAAGITTGCSVSPPMYCPDAPVTRGQMAVFISRALGLQFAP